MVNDWLKGIEDDNNLNSNYFLPIAENDQNVNDLGSLFTNNKDLKINSAMTLEGKPIFYYDKQINLDKVWMIVDNLRNFISTDVILQSEIKSLILTRDPDINNLQKDKFIAILSKQIAARGGLEYEPENMGNALDFIFDEIVGISVLGDLWRDSEVTEIMVDAWDKITIEYAGKLQDTKITFRSKDHANDVARALALRVSDRSVSQKFPLVTAELPQARVTFCYGSVVKSGLSITIRKFRPLLNLNEILNRGSLNDEMLDFLKEAVLSRATILVSGGTGTGKTTIINLLSSFIPDSERVITIEDAFELQLSNAHVVSLQTKESSSADDTVSVSLSDLLRNSLRMRPDRIIVGEIREGEGAITMLAASNTGHDGTMTTIHANSPSMAVNERLPDLVRYVRDTPDEVVKRSVASAFDLVIQITRNAKGFRYISDISIIDDIEIEKNGRIVLKKIFSTEEKNNKIIFKNINKVKKASKLGLKISSSIGDNSRWLDD